MNRASNEKRNYEPIEQEMRFQKEFTKMCFTVFKITETLFVLIMDVTANM